MNKKELSQCVVSIFALFHQDPSEFIDLTTNDPEQAAAQVLS